MPQSLLRGESSPFYRFFKRSTFANALWLKSSNEEKTRLECIGYLGVFLFCIVAANMDDKIHQFTTSMGHGLTLTS